MSDAFAAQPSNAGSQTRKLAASVNFVCSRRKQKHTHTRNGEAQEQAITHTHTQVQEESLGWRLKGTLYTNLRNSFSL